MTIYVRDMRERGKCVTSPFTPEGATRHLNELIYCTDYPSLKVEEKDGDVIISVYSEYTEDPANFLPEEILNNG